MSVANLGDLIDKLTVNRDKMRKLEEQMKSFRETKSALEAEIMAALESAGLDKASGKKATVSMKTAIVGRITDIEKMNRYIKQHGAFELYERRISSVAYREHLENRKGKPVPGTEPYERTTLNLLARS